MKDICCIGHVTLDKIVTPDRTLYQNGGTAYYFAYGINHLPHDVSFQMVTAIAQKDREAISRMEAEGIDVIAFDSKETVFFENKYGNNRNARSQRVLAKSDPFTVEQMEGLEARVFHLGSLLSDDMTDILKLNEYEMEVITGEKDPRRVAKMIAGWGVKEVVLTFGSYGSQIYCDGKFYDIPAYEPQHCIDVTGCGDTFSTGYLYCRAKGMDCGEAGKFAAAMCTLKIEKPGPFCEDISRIERIIRLGANI